MKTKSLILAALFLPSVIVFNSCKKTNFEKGTLVCKINGKSFKSETPNGQVSFGALLISGVGTVSGNPFPAQINITFEEGASNATGNNENSSLSGSLGTDVFATHWDGVLKGNFKGKIEVLTETECKGTFEATCKTEDGSETFEIKDGKFWLDI